jgi:hypothetical protein
MRTPQIAQHQQRESSVEAVASLTPSTHGRKRVLVALENLGGFDEVPVSVQVGSTLNRLVGAGAQPT